MNLPSADALAPGGVLLASGIIESRAKLRVNGASWQVDATQAFERRGLDRPAALKAMLGGTYAGFADTPTAEQLAGLVDKLLLES